jgi:hypothetical protein
MNERDQISFIPVKIFRVVTLFIDVIGDQRFGGPFCLHLQGEINDGIVILLDQLLM